MRLRPLRKTDIESLAWLPAVAEKSGFDRWSSSDALGAAIGDNRLLCIDESGPQGIIEYALDHPVPAAACVRFLAVDPSHRRLGIGGRAALALERRLKRSTDRIYVSVPARVGIALYFWLRLGYRPLTQADWPVAPEDPPSTWMVRELR
jgi:GNAT superfamily N-acetyltransferase